MPTESPQPNVSGDPTAGLERRFWLLVPVVGVGAGIGAGLLMKLLRLVQRIAWPAYAGNFLRAVDAASPAHRVLVLLGAGAVIALLRWVLRRPTGGHSAELTETLWFHAGRLPPLRTLGSAVTSIVAVGLGASVGREAAPKQVGAGIASVLGLRLRLPPAHRRLLVALGAGAGMGAVYNVPLGGALFALEVLLGTLALPLVAPALATSFIATAVSWLLLPNEPTYRIPVYAVSAPLLVSAALIGPAAGLVSAGYVRLIAWADGLKPKTTAWLIAAPVAVLFTLGLLSIRLPGLLGNGKDVVQLAFVGRMAAMTALLLAVLKPLATAGCLGSGTPGGLFTPTLTVGAAFGAFAGRLLLPLGAHAPDGACALIGAAAVLAASTQGPASAIVLVLELTRRMDTIMVPIMLAVAEAVLVARLLEARSIYSGRIHTGTEAARRREGQVPRISSAARYVELLHTVMRMGRDATALKVIDERGEPIGEIPPGRVMLAAESRRPLEIATARDFVIEDRCESPTGTSR
jgi:CIC family chloride channel protein